MILEKIIKINGWEIKDGLCSVGFTIRVYFIKKSKSGQSHTETELTNRIHAGETTHDTVYSLLETANTIEINSKDCVSAYHGNIKTEIYKRL